MVFRQQFWTVCKCSKSAAWKYSSIWNIFRGKRRRQLLDFEDSVRDWSREGGSAWRTYLDLAATRRAQKISIDKLDVEKSGGGGSHTGTRQCRHYPLFILESWPDDGLCRINSRFEVLTFSLARTEEKGLVLRTNTWFFWVLFRR